MVLKRIDWRLGRCSTAAAVWSWLSAEEAEAAAGLVAADVLAVRSWWLQERWLIAGVSGGENGCGVYLLVTHHRLKVSEET